MVSFMVMLLKGLWKYKQVAMVGIIVGLVSWNALLRRDIKSWKFKVATVKEQIKVEAASARRAEAGRELLAAQVDSYMAKAKENEQKVKILTKRIQAISASARAKVKNERAKYEARLGVLKSKLKNLDECNQCLVGVDWLEKEVGWGE